jgi:hypothetical protein
MRKVHTTLGQGVTWGSIAISASQVIDRNCERGQERWELDRAGGIWGIVWVPWNSDVGGIESPGYQLVC